MEKIIQGRKTTFSQIIVGAASILIWGAPSAREAAFGNEAICKAAISLVMNQKPAIVKASSQGNEVLLSYKRPADGKRFEYKCLVKEFEKRVVWAAKLDNGWGRWRDGQYDSVISYRAENGNLIVDEDGHSKKFKASEL